MAGMVLRELLSDNHKEFSNEIVKTFLRYTGAKPINSIPYSHEDNAIVERVIEEVRRHLAALRLDFESAIAWSVQLPIVNQYLFNTGVRPRDIKIGLYTGKDTDLFDKEIQPGRKLNWADRIVAVQRRLVSQLADRLAESNKANDSDVTIFTPGTFVMVKSINHRKGDLQRTASQGPFEVISQEGNKASLYDYRHEQLLKDVQVSRCRLYCLEKEIIHGLLAVV
jgi:hypothetical protein